MSMDITFQKRITLKELEKHKEFNLQYHQETQLWTVSKDEDNWLQIIVDKPSGDIEKDNDRILFFTARGHGHNVIRMICMAFKTSFITDKDEENLYYNYQESLENCYAENLKRIGLKINTWHNFDETSLTEMLDPIHKGKKIFLIIEPNNITVLGHVINKFVYDSNYKIIPFKTIKEWIWADKLEYELMQSTSNLTIVD